MMGDGAVIWWLVMSLNGLAMSSVEPFHSEEACTLAGRTAQIELFECVDVHAPEGMIFEESS